MMPFSVEDIPDELRHLPQWVLWKLEMRGDKDKPTKPLHNPHNGRKARTQDEAGKAYADKPEDTWGSFDEAVAAYKRGGYEGIGFVFSPDDPYAGVDLDNCVSEGKLEEWAQGIVDSLASYTEISPSGTGVHILVKGSLPKGGRKRGNLEMYEAARYFTVTGKHLPSTPTTIEERTVELAQLHARWFDEEKPHTFPSCPPAPSLNDETLLQKARSAKNGDMFAALYDRGDLAHYGDDDSRADLALAGLLMFWTGGDYDRAERLFSGSVLGQCDKWRDRPDYRRRTLNAALLGKTEFYKLATPALVQKVRSKENVAQEEAAYPNLDTQIATHSLTDLGNAERLVARHGDNLRYCAAWGQWFMWEGTRWRQDETRQAMEFAKSTVRRIYAEAASVAEQDKSRAEALAGWAKRSESRDRITAMLTLAQSDPLIAIHPDDFDANPWLLNVQNGTLDLHTGQLLAHWREDLLTKIAPVELLPETTSPIFDSFLARILPDADVRAFLQRAAGYSLTADVSEQVLFFLYGSRQNGKSTFLNAMLDILGDYGKQAAPDLLIAKGGSHPTDVADLRGSRFVSTMEVEDGKRMAEGLVKQLTGGDRLKARFMRQDFFEFDCSFKLWFAANHRPVVRGTDFAIWRRIRLIPFTETICDEEKDRHLREKLQAESSGILNWLVQGCLLWLQEGLLEPAAVKSATAEYRTDMDTIGQFLDEECVFEPNAKVPSRALYAAYTAWCEANGEQAVTLTQLGSKLTERGLQKRKGFGATGAHGWIGIRLRDRRTAPSPPDEEDEDTERGEPKPSQELETDPFLPFDEKGTDLLKRNPVLTQEKSLAKTLISEKGSDGSERSVSPLVLVATETQRQCAEAAAQLRKRGHDSCRKPEEDGGSDAKNLRRDYFGCLAEILVRQWLEGQGLQPESILVTNRPVQAADVTLNGLRLEIKSSSPGYGSLAINKKQHDRQPPSCDYYLPCLFAEDERTLRLMLPILHADVNAWPIAQVKNGSAFYHTKRECLKSLTSSQQLLRLIDLNPARQDKAATERNPESQALDTARHLLEQYAALIKAAQQKQLPEGQLDPQDGFAAIIAPAAAVRVTARALRNIVSGQGEANELPFLERNLRIVQAWWEGGNAPQ